MSVTKSPTGGGYKVEVHSLMASRGCFCSSRQSEKKGPEGVGRHKSSFAHVCILVAIPRCPWTTFLWLSSFSSSISEQIRHFCVPPEWFSLSMRHFICTGCWHGKT